MKFLLIGCNGKMGKTISKIAKEHEDIIVCGVDLTCEKQNFKTYTNINQVTEELDAIIDFSTTENHIEFISFAQSRNLPYGLFSTVVNNDTKHFMKEASKFIPILFCKNASIGVNLLYEMLETCASKIPSCETIIQEYHHRQKIDKPSGTAKDIENILKNNNINFETFSYRVGKETGTHIIQFFLQDETITLTHTAHSRDIFAHGAIVAMHKLKNKENDLYFKP